MSFTSNDLKFTDEQIAAITSSNPCVLISAGAGSGKTTVMAERVAYFIQQCGVLPDQILGLTFTRFATAELQSRVQKRLGSKSNEFDTQPAFHTYHSFSERIFRENALRIGFEPDSIALTDVRRNQLAAQVIRQSTLPLGNLESKFSSIMGYLLDLDDNLSNNVVSTHELREFDSKLAVDLEAFEMIGKTKELLKKSSKRLLLADLVDEFRLAKRVRSVIDYADMARLALQILETAPEVVSQYQELYTQILLDEYQDTSISQRELLRTLFTGADVGITAVGDPLQAIFSFQGGNIDNIINFGSYYSSPSQEPLNLRITQRNGKNILHLANLVGQPVRDAYPDAKMQWLVPAATPKYGDGRVEINSYLSTKEEAEAIADRFTELHGEGIAYEDMAVLAHNNSELQKIAEVLSSRDIPIQIRSKRALINLPEIAEIISYMKVIANPAANIDWLRLLTGPRFALSMRDVAGLGRISRSLSTYVMRESSNDFESEIARAIQGHDQADIAAYGDVLEYLSENDTNEISHDALMRVRLLQSDIEYLRQYITESLPALAGRILNTTGLAVELYAHQERIERGIGANVQAFISMLSDFSSLKGTSSLFDFISWLSDAERYGNMVTIEIPERRGAVNLMTIHGSKGLQFRAVAVPYLSENIFPTSNTTPRWTGTPSAIPIGLKNVRVKEGLVQFPPRNRKIVTKDHDNFVEICREEDLLEERRLLYVALTRTEDVLLISHAYIEGSTVRKPSRFFEELTQHAKTEPAITCNLVDFVEPAELQGETPRASWPTLPQSAEMFQIRELATMLRYEIDRNEKSPLIEDDTTLDWDLAIASLIKTRQDELQKERFVELPESLSASDVMRLAQDEASFVFELVRPMPQAPHFGADMGTLFHEWVENYFRQKSAGALTATLPGAEDLDQLPADIIEQKELRELIDKFMESSWANRLPIAIEEPFTIIINDRIIKGRIDAVFQDGDRWLLVDWKTHGQKDADPLQLSIYRIAYAKSHNVPLESIDAAFVYVRRGETVVPDNYVDESDLRL